MMDDFEFSALCHLARISILAVGGIILFAAALVIGDTENTRYWVAIGMSATFFVWMLAVHFFWERKWSKL